MNLQWAKMELILAKLVLKLGIMGLKRVRFGLKWAYLSPIWTKLGLKRANWTLKWANMG